MGRFHALDAVRAMALLLGIVLHACMSFLPAMREIGFPVVDDSSSEVLNALFLLIHMFRMPLFFVMAGYFARLVVQRRGVAAFARDRLLRIVRPLVLGWIVIVPLTGGILYAVAQQENKPLFHPNIPPGSALQFPLAHLWFLYVLVLVYIGFMTLRWMSLLWLGRHDRLLPALRKVDAVVHGLVAFPVGVLVLAAPLAFALYHYEWWWVSLGIPTPDYSLLPNPPALVGYGLAFTLGWSMQRQPGLLLTLARLWLDYLLLGSTLTFACVAIAGTSMAAVITGPAERMVYALCYCAASWCWIFALTGAAVRFMPQENLRWRYLADASYWMYLVHLPLVFALQALVMHWPLHWSLKFAGVLILALALPLLSYKHLVRHTWLGKMLNGRRYPANGAAVPAQ
ncbi:MAG: acyltransferase family protein [Bdellovibrionales bacterium]|nr:acyltransferase family protein [Ramlibacter sp.]